MMVGGIGGQNAGLRISAVNRSIAHKNEAMTGKKHEERIAAIISPAGKKQSMIEQLMKQKQDLTERMSSLSASASENGVNIQDQMEEYRKQLDSLDEQILKLQTQQEDEKENGENTGIYEKPMTEEELESKKMNSSMNLAVSSDQVEVLSSVKGKVDGRANVLKSEIKTGFGNTEAKLAEVAELEGKSADIASQMGQKMADMNEEVNQVRNEAVKDETVRDETVSEGDKEGDRVMQTGKLKQSEVQGKNNQDEQLEVNDL